MDRPLLPIAVGRGLGEAVTRLHEPLVAALAGDGPAVAPYAAGGPPPHGPVPAPVAVVLRTSGSTGRPRDVMLDAAALLASARATHERLGGPGRWVLSLPPVHVAGLQVLVRSALAGHRPVVVDQPHGFEPGPLLDALAAVPDDAPLYVSLVPTQLHRLLADDAPEPVALRRARVLVGGSAAPRGLLDRAGDAGLDVVTTYGMTETCGGCVYDGRPLDGVQVRLGPGGVVELGGPVLARGHLHRPGLDREVFAVDDDGRRWLLTRDLGRLHAGRLEVLGRADDVLVTGGVNVAPAAVERVLSDVRGVGEVCVVGVPDPEWGTALTAVVVPAGDPPTLTDLRAAARTLGDAAAPRHLVVVDALDLRGPGKVDRTAVARRARDAVVGTEEDHGDHR